MQHGAQRNAGGGMVEVMPAPVSWVLPASGAVSRIPARPVAFRKPNFDDQYDSHTVFFDAFWTEAGKRIILLGPSLLNLRDAVADMTVTAMPSGSACKLRVIDLDRHAQVWIEPPSDTFALEIHGTLGDVTLPLRDNACERFADKRVVFTLSKNNKIDWIADWIRYHRDVHGANGVLIYDNDSDDYTLAELESRLEKIAGVDAIAIVPWAFKYGPQGYGGRHWDSDYCQIGAMQDARWRFLQRARSVVNLDVDELIVSRDRSVFELVESAPSAYVSFFGEWVVGTDDRDPVLAGREQRSELVRHADFSHTLRIKRTWKRHPKWKIPLPGYLNRSPPKWGIVPARCPLEAQWTAHAVTTLPASLSPMSEISYRHFREIATGWKYDRAKREPFDRQNHRRDDALAAAYANVRWDR